MNKYKLKELSLTKLEYGSGAAAVEFDGCNRYIRITDIDNDGNLNDDIVSPKSIEEQYLLNEGDILFARTGATVGKTFRYKVEYGKCYYAGFLIRLVPNTGIINPDYLFYFTKSPRYRQFVTSSMKVVAQPNINAKQYGELEISVPDLKTQEFIVRQLNHANNIMKLKHEQLKSLDELIKSRFVELFGLPVSNTKGWKTEQMNDVAPVVNYTGEFDDAVWLLNLDMVESQTGRIIDYLTVSKEEISSSTCTFDTSNVLYSKLRPYLNKVVIPDRCGYATSELVPLQPVKTKINREYLAFLLRSDEFVNMINEKVAGAKMPRVSMGDFRKFDVPIPPMTLQNQFAAFVEQIDKSKVAIQKSLEENQLLMDSLMQKYFG